MKLKRKIICLFAALCMITALLPAAFADGEDDERFKDKTDEQRAMVRLPTQTVALMSYLDPITALLLSALVLHEPLSPAGLAGAALGYHTAAADEARRAPRCRRVGRPE